jgi:alcohol dehydrogenase class IV
MALDQRQAIHQAIDKLPEERLAELRSFIGYLFYKDQKQGAAWFKAIYDLFEPVRTAVAESGMTEEEVDQILDDALEEVRRERDAQSRS